MEEIITVDGRQFKLTTDRPLTAQEKAQTIAEIRKQTGCSTCGPSTLDPNWRYGGIRSMSPATCTTALKASGQTITLQANPYGGVGPYTVRFWRKSAPGAYTLVGTTKSAVAEGSATSETITLNDLDVSGAIGDATAGLPTTGTSGAITDPEDTTAALAAGKIRVATTTTDLCTAPGAQSCVEYCDVNLACVAPTCNFVVS